MKRHLFLIGYRGSGKSSVGLRLASRFAVTAVDTDDRVEAEAGRTIREIFAEEGETGFRDRESQVLDEVAASRQPTIVSLGGGAILREMNRQRITASGWSVWLQASPEVLASRMEGDASTSERRPALTAWRGLDEIVRVLAAREPLYRELADWVIVTDGKSIDEIVDEVAEAARRTFPPSKND